MATITLDGRQFNLPPYRLGALRQAAPFIDRINQTAGALSSLEGMFASLGDIVAVLSIGLVKLDPKMTQDVIEDLVGFDEMSVLRDCFEAVLTESGLTPGEVEAPPQAQAVDASKAPSEVLSTS